MVRKEEKLEYLTPSIEVIRFQIDRIMTTSMPDIGVGDDDGTWTGWY